MRGECVGAAADAGLREAVHERVQRFAALRSVQRALTPSVREAEQLFPPEQVRDVLERLRSLTQASPGEAEAGGECDERALAPGEPESLAELDDRLDEVASRLLDALDAVSLAQLRATLPTSATTYPEEVLALLNLCASNARGHAQRIRVAEYVLTLLSSDLREGVRSLVRDPQQMSPAIAALGMDQREKLDSRFDPADVAVQFRAAAVRLQQDDGIQATLEEMRALKEDLGEAIFLSEIICDAVAYNIGVWNRQEELLDEERTSDRIAEVDLLFSTEVEFEQEDLEGKPEPESEEKARSVEEAAQTQAEGIARVEEAIGRRIRGEEPTPGLPGMLTLELDPATLGDRERHAYSEDSDDPSAKLIRTIVATAVVLQHLPEGAERLREIDLSQAVLQGDWIRHLSQEIQRAMRTLVAASRYEDARALSAIKHKYMYSSLTELIRERAREAGMGRGSSASIEGAREAIAEATSATITREVIVRELKRPANYVALLLVVLVTSLVFRVATVRPRPIQILSQQELEQISPYIASGYRGKSGASPLFIGTVKREWSDLTVENERVEGAKLASELEFAGVTDVMLFDASRKLRFHYSAGTIRLPKLPDE